MIRLIVLNIFLLISISLAISCERISTTNQGELEILKLANLKGIPSEYGSLISVTVPTDKSSWAHLWFQDATQTIRMVRIGYADNRVHEKVTVIPRY